MKDFAEKLESDDMLVALKGIVPVTTVEVTKEINVHPDFSTAKYEGMTTKEYPIHDTLNLSSQFLSINEVELEDAGYLLDGDFHEDKGDGVGKINCAVGEINQRMCSIDIKGTIYVSGLDMDGDGESVVMMKVTGVEKTEKLSIFQSLVLEGHALYMESNFRMSFFTLFTAIEAAASDALMDYKNKIHSELHDSLEKLPLDEKIRIAVKEFFATEKLDKLKVWSDFMGLFREMKDVRNKMAHPRSFVSVKKGDVVNMFMLICIFDRLRSKPKTYAEIRRHFYPKKWSISLGKKRAFNAAL